MISRLAIISRTTDCGLTMTGSEDLRAWEKIRTLVPQSNLNYLSVYIGNEESNTISPGAATYDD